MRVGVETCEKEIYQVAEILNSNLGKEIELEDLLLQALMKNVYSSDIIFLLLQNLEEMGFIKGKRGSLIVKEEIGSEVLKDISKNIWEKISKSKKLFVTPLEVAKFFQCPRRLFLEKIILAKQYKEEVGKTWDGEAVHYSVNIFIKNLAKMQVEQLMEEAAKRALKKFNKKVTISQEEIVDFLERFYELIKKEGFTHILIEKKFESFKAGLTGTPDIVGIKKSEIIPIDIKLGKISEMGVKEEHLLQSIGESILVEEFFRKKVNFSYLIYFTSKSLVKVKITNEMKKKFLYYKRGIERMCKMGKIPSKGKLPNLEKRVCLGCHVRPSCENIEMVKRIE
ncbi:MAG: PD-(D/E)XK nuclease family protein [Candidatus Aenigmatarchaeota archaeon]